MKRRALLIILPLAASLLLLVSCAQSTTESAVFKPAPDNFEKPTQSPEDTSVEVEEGIEEEYLKCFQEYPNPVAQDISERFETAYEMVEDWYCQGNSFEDIMLALMTGKLWEIDPDLVLLELETKTWDEIWADLGNPQ
jgi:hypothetical protein